MVTIIYDGECPLCSHYITRLRLIEAYGAVELVNARDPSSTASHWWARGYNIDEGMIVIVDGAVHYGDEAAMMLARLSANDAPFDRLYNWSMSHPSVARLAYPVLKVLRRIALRINGSKGLVNPVSSVGPPDK